MISIQNLQIINNNSQLSIDVITNEGYFISSIVLWTMNNFKNYSLEVDLSSYIEGINNQEVLIINAEDIGLSKFEDIIFVEIKSTYESVENCTTCQNPGLGITYNLSKYYQCLINYLIDLQLTQCINCNNVESKDTVITINLLIDMVYKSLEIGYYDQAIDMINKLKKLCSLKNCNNCPTIECTNCNNFIQVT